MYFKAIKKLNVFDDGVEGVVITTICISRLLVASII